MTATRGSWKYDFGNWQVEAEDTRQPICDLSMKHDIGKLSGEDIDKDEVISNGLLLAAAPDLKRCCAGALVYLKLEGFLEKQQLIDELERVLEKTEF